MHTIYIEEGGYEEKTSVITDIRFTLQEGEIIGLIGGNGAGKSTTIQAMLGTLPYVKGEVTLPTFGYVPERPILYDYYTLAEHIHLLVQCSAQPETVQKRAYELASLFKLDTHFEEYPTTFSKGMQQKVMLILAFAPRYSFYIVDEPFMGLDPQAIRALIRLLIELRDEGATILLSTHALDTAEKMCNRFLCLHNGVLIAQGSLQALQQHRDEPLLDIFDRVIDEVTYASIS